MSQLPITFHNLKHTPESPGNDRDGYRWHVGLEEDVLLVVDLSGSAAAETGLSRAQLHDRLPHALQRYAAGMRNDRPIIEQILGWNSPIILSADYFR